KQKRPASAQSSPQAAPSFRNFFGFGGQPRQVQPAPRQNTPRPPANVGRSASVPPRNVAQ
ncbi:MAG: hypothetical protein KGJ00_24645, partial [Bradyrhizobium sp.]|nr:hypothetical protein [Bradyrhizobium sp.]